MCFVIAIDHNEVLRVGLDDADSRYFVAAFRISFVHTCRHNATTSANRGRLGHSLSFSLGTCPPIQ